LFAKDEIRSVGDLKGKSVGVQTAGERAREKVHRDSLLTLSPV
jgi:ABC-type amino acid transport substrate-binding protein